MSKVLVTYCSRTENTAKMARIIADGAEAVGSEVDVSPVAAVLPDDLLEYDGVIAGASVCAGEISLEMKKFFKRIVKLYGMLDGKIGAAFTSTDNTGEEKEAAILEILHNFLMHGMVIQGLPKCDFYGPVAFGAPDKIAARQCWIMGESVARRLAKSQAVNLERMYAKTV